MDDYRVELFIFPDGMAIEMLVFDQPHAAAAPQATPAQSASVLTRPGQSARRNRTAPATHEQSSLRRAAVSQCAVPQPPATPAATCDGEGAAPHRCPVCHSELVYPTDWERLDGDAWSLSLRCPNCETQRTVVLHREQVEHFNKVLYQGTELLTRQVELFARQRFEEDVHAFVAALERDLIQPSDF